MSKFKKGVSGNPKGRPKGAKDRIKGSIAERVKEIIELNFATLQEDLEAVEPKERIQFVLKLLEYAIPKAQAEERESKPKSLIQQTIDAYLKYEEV